MSLGRLILLVFLAKLSIGNGLKCYKCEDDICKDDEKGNLIECSTDACVLKASEIGEVKSFHRNCSLVSTNDPIGLPMKMGCSTPAVSLNPFPFPKIAETFLSCKP